ncbi:MAG: molybdenum cofactor guanylyltransferase [Bacteroidales bacterium]|nr:molybdenum cofactor guanylyltransferase [Bacteroidales bacterium]MBN2758166.1 molybdenum cofactor guanylyltransferase [Bacteroidales bacterium]
MEKINITGIVLCGGRSIRMGENKALLKLNNKFIISYVIDSLKEFCDEIILSTNSNELDFLNLKTIADEYKNIGPIAGILSGLESSKTDLNIIASCDTPFFSSDLINFLLKFSNQNEIVIPEFEDFLQPITGIFKKSVIKTIKQEIELGNHSPQKIIKKANLKIVKIDNSLNFFNNKLFMNINTKEDYENAKQIIDKRMVKQ